jgi:hypothetical protein
VEVSKEQLKNGINVSLHSLRFFKDHTEADISITNDNTDDELELSEGDSSAPLKIISVLLLPTYGQLHKT